SSSTRRSRAQIATSTPSPASSWAIALPMPLLPPVTIATFPASPRSMCNVPRRCPREARRARERLAHLPPEVPRAKANPERRDEPEELRVHGVHPRSPHEHGSRQPGEVSDRVQTGEGLDTFGTSKCTESLSRTKLLEDRVLWLQQFFGLHRGALV